MAIEKIVTETAEGIRLVMEARLPGYMSELDPIIADQATDELLYTMFMFTMFKDASEKASLPTSEERTAFMFSFAYTVEVLRERGISEVRRHRPARPTP